MKHYYRLAALGAIIITLAGCTLTTTTKPEAVAPTTGPTIAAPSDGSSGTVPAPGASGSVQPSGSGEPAPTCPPGISLPDGVDPHWVCAPTPASMRILPSFPDPVKESGAPAKWNGFKTPDGNVVCSWYEGGTTMVTCRAKDMNVPLPPDPKVDNPQNPSNCTRGLTIADYTRTGLEAGKACAGGVTPLDYLMDNNADVPVLEYGYSVRSLDYAYPWTNENAPDAIVACITEADGVTCWDADGTHHGFKIGKNIATFW